MRGVRAVWTCAVAGRDADEGALARELPNRDIPAAFATVGLRRMIEAIARDAAAAGGNRRGGR